MDEHQTDNETQLQVYYMSQVNDNYADILLIFSEVRHHTTRNVSRKSILTSFEERYSAPRATWNANETRSL